MKHIPKYRIVDTNVLVVANGRHGTHAGERCKLSCIEALEEILESNSKLIAIVDQAMEIQSEYRSFCNPSGQPSVGDLFYQAIIQNYAGKVLRIELVRDENGNYLDFPDDVRLGRFDESDRKFAAAAKKSGGVVLNAADTRSWPVYRDVLLEFGIKVIELC